MSDELKAWLKECEILRAEIQGALGHLLDDAVFMEAVYSKAIRPFHYFQQANGGPPPQAQPRAPAGAGETAAVEVFRTQFKHAPIMKEWRLRWDPAQKRWHGNVPREALADFAAFCVKEGLKVEHD